MPLRHRHHYSRTKPGQRPLSDGPKGPPMSRWETERRFRQTVRGFTILAAATCAALTVFACQREHLEDKVDHVEYEVHQLAPGQQREQ